VVSDGGVEGGKGYFGVIQAVGHTVIARARGAAHGDPRTMSLFRAKVYRFLAGILLLRLMTQPDMDRAKNEIHTNNASLLTRLKRATSTYIPVGFWLKADSDIV
jgi:hypothetical protein